MTNSTSQHGQFAINAGFWQAAGPHVLLPENEASLRSGVLACLGKSGVQDAVVFTSSGSSGVPKLTVLRRAALLASARSVVAWLDIRATDKLLCALPVYHVGGFGVFARAHVSGAQVVLHASRWHAGEVVEKIAREGISVISLVPAQVFDLVRERLQAPPCLRLAVIGGGHLAQGSRIRSTPTRMAGSSLLWHDRSRLANCHRTPGLAPARARMVAGH